MDSRTTPNGGNQYSPAATLVTRREFLKLGGAGMVGALLLGTVACGGGEGGGGQESLRSSYQRAIENLDPHGSFGAEQGTLLAATQIFDSLVVKQGDEVKPSVATEWRNPDSRTWVFTLQDDVTFHDGTRLTANDVKASLERVKKLEGPLAPLFESVSEVEATDEHTVTIKTSEPLGPLPANLTTLWVLPADKMNNEGFFRSPVGSGPYRPQSFVPSQRLELTSYADYWDGAPPIKQAEIAYIPETSARITAIETGELDLTWTIEPDQIPQLKGNSEIKLVKIPSWYYWFNWFNCGRKPFSDPNVRRAMWHAIDTDTIVKELFGDLARPIRAPIPSTVFGYAEQEPYEYDPERARRMLADAGYPDGFSTSVMWNTGSAPQIRQFAETLISYWADIGVKVEPQELEQAQWLDKLLNLDWDMDLQTNDVATGDADYTLGRLYTSEANRMGYSNPRLDRILNDARTTTDQKKRADLYGQACEIIWNDAVGIFPAELMLVYALRSSIEHFEPGPIEVVELDKVSFGGQE